MEENSNGVRVLLGNQRKGVMALAVPIAIALTAQMLNNLADSFWVSDLGGDAMAALGFISPLYCVLIGIGNGLGIGVSAAIARNIGMRNRQDAEAVAAQGLVITLVVSLILTVLLVSTAEPLIEVMGAGDLRQLSLEYAMPFYIAAITVILSGVMSGMLRGEGAAKRSMAIQVVGAGINVVLDPILIFVLDMGVSGAAWATVISFVVSILMAFYWYLKGSLYIHIRASNFRIQWRLWKEILGVGLPETVELVIMNLFNVFLNYYVLIAAGATGLAVYTTTWRIAYMVMIPSQAFGGALVAVCSAEYGMKEFGMIRDAFRFSTKMSTIYTVALCALMAVIAPLISMVFMHTPDMIGMQGELTVAQWVFALYLPFFTLVYVGSPLLQALEHATGAMVNSLIRNIIVTIAYAIAALCFGGLWSIWVALVVVEVIGGLAMLLHARIVLDKVERKEAVPAVTN